MKKWFCVVCGYVHDGDAPPNICPVCGVGPEDFEDIGDAAEGGAAEAGPLRVVVVGNGAAGHHAAQAARRAAPDASVRLLAGEPHPFYNRLGLTMFVAGNVPRERLFLANADTYRELRVETHLGDPVVALRTDPLEVATRSGERFACDRVVLCTGAHAFVPPIRGSDLPGVVVLRSLDDADHLVGAASTAGRAVVIGGGLLGLETAFGLHKRGVASVTVLETAPRLMPRQLDGVAATLFQRRVEALGLGVRADAKVEAIESGETAPLRVRLADGADFPADLVVIAAGIVPETGLAKAAGLDVRRGVLVDERMRTSHPAIWAAGDCAERGGVVHGLWPVAMSMGMVAGANAAGGDETLAPPADATFLKVLGIPVFSVGAAADPPASAESLAVLDEEKGAYRKLVLQDDRVIGGILVGDPSGSVAVRTAVERGVDVGERRGDRDAPPAVQFDRILSGL